MGAHAEKVARARALRSDMTDAERALWQRVQHDALGVRVRRQHVIQGWIVDFYVPTVGLVIEVDGDVHDLQADEDARRTDALEAIGLLVLRVRNEAMLATPMEVLDRLRAVIRARRRRPS